MLFRSERAALEGALEVTRRELTLLRAEPPSAPAIAAKLASPGALNAEDARRLREDIRGVGAEVSRLVAALQREADEKSDRGEAPPPLDERMRELLAHEKRAVAGH